MYVKHLQEYLDQFTDGNKGTAISNAEIFVEMDNGRLQKKGRP
jgi:prophage maintenance system killer protein